ncbi:hypothetical protein DQ384_29235 [Sphaerisporangium album]|uniref:Uncharacterized protein n=1 Tax=Sphaerisporangium album TaxID=509200 RepID=A0A367F842_9ACTN|nr:hypothetical protein [Sphaerisporangium album]RCG26524.1 hypothetical protein DQ384_29235 [Sphaerisporangium album]
MWDTFPVEGQRDLLREHGLHDLFSGQWVQTEDVGDVVRRLGVDPASGVVCDFPTAMRSYDRYSDEIVVWLGEHAPGWAHMLTLSGTAPPKEVIDTLSAGRRRVFDVFFIWETGHLNNRYTYDGVCIGDVSPPYPGGVGEVEEFTPYSRGLELGDGMSTAEVFDRILCMVGRITGRFIDRDWFSSPRTLYRLPRKH